MRGGHQQADRGRALKVADAVRTDSANGDPGTVGVRRRVGLAGQDNGQIGTRDAGVLQARAGVSVSVQHHLDRAGHALHGDRVTQVDEKVKEAGIVLDGDRAQVDGGAGWGVAERVGDRRGDALPVVKGAVGPDGKPVGGCAGSYGDQGGGEGDGRDVTGEHGPVPRSHAACQCWPGGCHENGGFLKYGHNDDLWSIIHMSHTRGFMVGIAKW